MKYINSFSCFYSDTSVLKTNILLPLNSTNDHCLVDLTRKYRYSQTSILCHLATMPPSLLYHFWSSPTKFNRKYIYYATTYPRYYATWGTVLQCINETINATNETIKRLWNGKSIQYVHVICSLKLSTVAQPKTLRNRQLAHVLSADFMHFVV